MTAAERKRAQRQRDRLAGWTEVVVKVAKDQAHVVRAFAADLPPPEPPEDPRQLSMIKALDDLLEESNGDATSDAQADLFGKE